MLLFPAIAFGLRSDVEGEMLLFLLFDEDGGTVW